MGYTQSSGKFGNGECAMELMGQWHSGVQAGNSTDGVGLTDQLGWFPFPAIEGGAGDPTDVLGGGDGIAIGANASDMAVEFAKFLSSGDSSFRFTQLPIGWLPVVASAEEGVTDPNLLQVLAARNAAGYYQSYYDQFLPPAVAQTVLDAVDGLLNGTLTPEEAAQMIEDSAAMEL
jgi:raffinose/stachyose/melibiose transport system substrate-binding protein